MIIKMHVGVRQVGYPFDVLLKLSNRTGWLPLFLVSNKPTHWLLLIKSEVV